MSIKRPGLSICIIAAVFSTLFFSCRGKVKSGKSSLCVTIETQRALLESLAGEKYKVFSFIPPGVSPETYDPTPVKIAEISRCSAYFSISGIGFNKELIKKIKFNVPDIHLFDTSKGIVFLQGGKDTPQDNSQGNLDPHLWNSPRCLGIIANNMANALVQIDPGNKFFYEKNLERLKNKIDSVDKSIKQILAKSKTRSFIIYHPALTYFAKDYGLKQYCIENEGKEPSSKQILSLINTAKKENIKVIFIPREFDKKNADTIAKETGCKEIVIDAIPYSWDKELIFISKQLSDVR